MAYIKAMPTAADNLPAETIRPRRYRSPISASLPKKPQTSKPQPTAQDNRVAPSWHTCMAYYGLWALGKPHTEIASVVEHTCMTSPGYCDKWQDVFFAFCKAQAAEDLKTQLADDGSCPSFALTDTRREELLALVGAGGMDVPRAADCMGIPLVVILEDWYTRDPSLSAQVANARDRFDADAAIALHRRVKGYSAKHVTSVKYTDPKTNKQLEDVTTVEEVVHPDPRSAIRWLEGRRPQEWTPKANVNLSGGLSIDAKLSAMTDDELDAELKKLTGGVGEPDGEGS